MAGAHYTPEIKTAVLALGAKGATYREIREKFPIPKSTLSVWFNAIHKGHGQDKSYMAGHLAKARLEAIKTIQRKKEERLSGALTQATKASDEVSFEKIGTLKSLAAMLYWAEGTKADTSSTVFTNTDPLLAEFYLDLLRRSFGLDETKLRIRLHLHHYHNQAKALNFWSKLLRVPKSQFGKIYVKKRSKQKRFRENFQGICFIIYYDMSVRRELMSLARLLAKKGLGKKLSSFNG